MNTITAEVLTELAIRNLRRGHVFTEPFPHVSISAFWPWEFYTQLLACFPDDAQFVQRGGYGSGKTRIATRVDAPAIWELCYNVLESEAFMHALCDLWRVQPGISRCLLHKDASGYTIAPHSDIESKRASYVCYFAPDMTHHHAGTWLLTHKRHEALPRERHHRWYDFEPVVLLPYMPNTFVSWAPGPKSYHAVDVRFAPDDRIKERHSIRGFVFAPEAELPFIFQEDLKERGLA